MSTEPAVGIKPLRPPGMIAWRADLEAPWAGRAALDAMRLALPAPLSFSEGAHLRAVWMSPDELLFFAPSDAVADIMTALEEACGTHHQLAADVSGLRVGFAVSGPGARDVLAKLTPANMAPGAFQPGTARRTRLGQIAVLILAMKGDRFEVFGFRSVERYLRELLATAARPGAPVRFHAGESRP